MWHLADENIAADDESEVLGVQLYDLAEESADVESLPVAEAFVEVFGPAGVVDAVLSCEHSLHACDALACAYPRHVAIAVSQLRSQVPS